MTRDANAHEHYGRKVDLSIAETLAALDNPPAVVKVNPKMRGTNAMIEYVLCIVFRGEWHELSRTDLFNDVHTGDDRYTLKTDADEELAFWRSKVRYGARISRHPYSALPFFAVVDSTTDG